MKSIIALFLIIAPSLFFIQDRVIEWLTETEKDFGDIPRQVSVTFDFKYKNISDQPITIDNVRAQCGCTTPDWVDELIEPDSVGIISITFDAHKKGFFDKKVKVYFSGQRKAEILYLSGYVLEDF